MTLTRNQPPSEADYAELERLLLKYSSHPVVKAALQESGSADGKGHPGLDKKIQSISSEVKKIEDECVEQYVKNSQSLLTLHTEVNACDGILGRMEDILSAFEQDLTGISSQIRKLQVDSLQMNVKLENRRAAHEVLSTFLNQIVVTPQLVKMVCEEEVSERYVSVLAELARKLEHARQPGVIEHPSSAACVPELEKLRAKAIARVRDFLGGRILALRTPKTNIQILQRNVLIRYKQMYAFLLEQEGQIALEIRTLYVTTLSKLYLSQFKTYVQSLCKLQLENGPQKQDLVGALDAHTHGPSGVAANLSAMGQALGLSKPGQVHGRGNVFGLSGRNALLKGLNTDPIVAHVQSTHKQKVYYEQIFRSHQKLLVDTATSEFLFLLDFFGLAEVPHLFVDVFARTISFFVETLEDFLFGCWDSVGLLIMTRVNEFHRLTMQRRKVRCIDAYLERVQVLLWPRLKSVLDANVASLRAAAHNPKPYIQGLPAQQRCHPHYITRRYAELCAALHTLAPPLGGTPPDAALMSNLEALQAAFEGAVEAMSREQAGRVDQCVFFINNYDLVLSVFHERALDGTGSTASAYTARLERSLKEQTALYVETTLMRHHAELIKYVREMEPKLGLGQGASSSSSTPPGEKSTASSAAPSASSSTSMSRNGGASSVLPQDIVRMEKLVRLFNADWRKSVELAQKDVMTAFTNFTNGTDILTQVLTQLLLFYTRFQKIIQKAFQGQPQPSFAKELVSNSLILSEIKQHSRAF